MSEVWTHGSVFLPPPAGNRSRQAGACTRMGQAARSCTPSTPRQIRRTHALSLPEDGPRGSGPNNNLGLQEMKTRPYLLPPWAATGCALCALSAVWIAPARADLGEFDEFDPIVEINATDGDVGFHMLLDGDAWRLAQVYDPRWRRVVTGLASGGLARQGITEFFLESAEPSCWEDPEEPDAEVVTVADFVRRFSAGTYHAFGWTLDRELISSDAELTHRLPAAPEVYVDVEEEDDGEVEVTIGWNPGEDLGRCAFDEDDLPVHPAGVQVVRWEIVVEPEEEAADEDGLPFGVFMVQLQADARKVEVPEEFIQTWLAAGITAFKVEVGAREESGNQTFTEVEFDLDGDEAED